MPPRGKPIKFTIPRTRVGHGLSSRQLGNRVLIEASRVETMTSRFFRARITGSQLVDDNKWLYSWQEQLLLGQGYQGWDDRLEGRSGTFDVAPGRNWSEEMNSGSGVQGNGINIDDLPGSFAVRPCPTGKLILMELVRSADGSRLEHWFDYQNPVDGTC